VVLLKTEELKVKLEALAMKSKVLEMTYLIAGHFMHGDKVEKDEKFAKLCILKTAKEGFPPAQIQVGTSFYERGKGESEDNREAVWWFQQAAEIGYPPGQWMLGLAFQEGNGVPHDREKAASWFQKAAEQGFKEAQYSLGEAFLHGNGVPRDEQKAFEWFRKAAEQGLFRAKLALYDEYRDELTKINHPLDEEAIPLFRDAANAGHANSQFDLGLAYLYGEGGLHEDEKIAVEWFRKAAEQGHAGAKQELQKLGLD